MTTRIPLTLGAVSLAALMAQPAFAANAPGTDYENSTYEYAVPASAAAQAPAPAAELPAKAAGYKVAQAARAVPEYAGSDYPPATAMPATPAPHMGSYDAGGYEYEQPYGDMPMAHAAEGFGREAWLDECRDRMGAGRRGDKSSVIGGVVGAAAGGLLGNRVAKRGDRLGGTLVGAGVGGLAGMAVGKAIDGGKRREARDYCESYLDYYTQGGGYAHGGYAQGGYGYYDQGYYGNGGYHGQACACAAPAYHARRTIMVPMRVPVQRRAIVREYVTERVIPETTYETVTEYEDYNRPVYDEPVYIKDRPGKLQPVKRVRPIK